MEKDKKTTDNWVDDILGKQHTAGDLGADESAVTAAGLTRPEDLELEKILQEVKAESAADEPTRKVPTIPQPQESLPPEEAAPAAPRKPAQEQAPEKAKKKPSPLWGITHILSTVVWLAIVLIIGVTLGRTVWVCAVDLLALGKEPQEITITVAETDGIDEVANKLERAGLIRYPGLFKLFTEFTGKASNILTGQILFSGEIVYDYNALANALSYRSSELNVVEVVIPEGYSCAQIFELLEEKKVCTVSELEAYAANGELDDYWFLEGIQRGHRYCLEGFLFPDTYEFYIDDDPERVLEKFLNDFDYRFNDRLQAKFEALKQRYPYLGLNIRKVVIMASIVEKEKANNNEGYEIASVFYNRLSNSASFPFLNSDATILYDVDYYSKGMLNTDAQKAASPYNTYTQTGLPAGPISNPGISSLDAALEPADTDYFYFIFDKSANEHLFSRTLAEHESKAAALGY